VLSPQVASATAPAAPAASAALSPALPTLSGQRPCSATAASASSPDDRRAMAPRLKVDASAGEQMCGAADSAR